jgi:hypothetical protein
MQHLSAVLRSFDAPDEVREMDHGRFEVVRLAAFEDGKVELRAGEMFYIPPAPHDRWVVGQERHVSLHLLGAHAYAK